MLNNNVRRKEQITQNSKRKKAKQPDEWVKPFFQHPYGVCLDKAKKNAFSPHYSICGQLWNISGGSAVVRVAMLLDSLCLMSALYGLLTIQPGTVLEDQIHLMMLTMFLDEVSTRWWRPHIPEETDSGMVSWMELLSHAVTTNQMYT